MTLNSLVLYKDVFVVSMSYIEEPKDFGHSMQVCKAWKQLIESNDVAWKAVCQNKLNIPSYLDPKHFLPKGCSYKAGVQFRPKVLDAKIYRDYLGVEIGVVPPIPKSINRCAELDPKDATNTIGQNYIWIYFPEIFKCKDDDGTFDVPNTFDSLEVLFKDPVRGYSSITQYVSLDFKRLFGDNQIPSGWVCMRELPVQKDRMDEKGIAILFHRAFYNLSIHTITGNYPDRFSTRAFLPGYGGWPFSCKAGSDGLIIRRDPRLNKAAVVLSEES